MYINSTCTRSKEIKKVVLFKFYLALIKELNEKERFFISIIYTQKKVALGMKKRTCEFNANRFIII